MTTIPGDSASLPPLPTENELAAKIRALQLQMGIPTDQEVDPLGPGAGADELWPTDTGDPETGLPTFRLV